MINLYLITQLYKVFCCLTANKHKEVFIFILSRLIYQEEFGENVFPIVFTLQRVS